ncbi:hypothetical protein [Geodermatophilus sp. SYSU D01176]
MTALAYYFGWVRTQAYLEYFGLDTSLVDFTTADYALRSIRAAYWPIMVFGFLVVVALHLHAWLIGFLQGRPARYRRGVRRLVSSAGLALLVAAAVARSSEEVSFPPSLPGIPLSITVGVALLAYSVLLGSERGGDLDIWREAQLVAMAGLIVGGLFWVLGSYADRAGERAAQQLTEEIPFRADVSVYSGQRLGLGGTGTGIEVQELTGENYRYLFRYTGLRLLLRSGERYFLLPKGWNAGEDAVVILTESESVRLEFVGPPQP